MTGRGREDFLGDTLALVADQGTVRRLPRARLHPAAWQPRRSFDRAALLNLAISVWEDGVKQPLLVRPHPEQPNHFEIVAGERRWRASDPNLVTTFGLSPDEQHHLLGQAPDTLPCMIQTLDDATARRISAVENLQRADLDPLEEAEYRLVLIQDALQLPHGPIGAARVNDIARELYAIRNESEVRADDIARLTRLFRQLGTMTWESYVSNHLPLLTLPDDLRAHMQAGRIAGRAALLIHRQTDPELRAALLDAALNGAPLQQLQMLLDERQGRAYRTLASRVRTQLTPKRLDRLPADARQDVVTLLEQLEEKLQQARSTSKRT